jgi:hypothetical protein
MFGLAIFVSEFMGIGNSIGRRNAQHFASSDTVANRWLYYNLTKRKCGWLAAS